jgi:hypothetical protein
MEHSTQPLRMVIWAGVAVAAIDLVVHRTFSFFVLTLMIALVGEYVGNLSRRLRDRPAYYVREEHTSSVLLREERVNVVQTSSRRADSPG